MPKVKSPSDWDKAVRAARLRYLGHSQEEAAEQVGIGRRTLINWEQSDWWPDAFREAESQGLEAIAEKARAVILDKLEAGDSKTAMWVLERRDKMFRSPSKQTATDDEADKAPDLSNISEADLRDFIRATSDI